MSEIDLYRIRDKIWRHFPAYWNSQEALSCLLRVWAHPDCNGVGVFNQTEEIRIDLKGQKQWYAEIHLAVAPNGWHTFGTNYWYGLGGGGYAPSVSNTKAYTTRDEFMDAALNELINKFAKLQVREYPGSEAQDRNAKKMIETLRARLTVPVIEMAPTRPEVKAAEPAQLSLFL